MKYALNRAWLFIVNLWAAVTLNFLIPHLVPGNPALAVAQRLQGHIDKRQLDAIYAQFGISRAPLWQQYFQYLWGLLHGRLGISFAFYPTTVSQVISQAMPWTLGLVGVTTIIAAAVGTLLGIVGAWKRNTVYDSMQSSIFMFLSAVPAFWLALIMVWYFGLKLGWFPLDHSYTDGVTPNFSLSFIFDVLHHLFLPGFALFITSLGGWMLGMRNNMVQVLGDDYVLFAEAMGIPANRIMMQYAARNAMLPNIAGLGMALGGVLGGSILVEALFSIPGVGQLFGTAISGEDYPLTQGLFLFYALALLVANLVVDAINPLVDPRVRVGRA